VSALAELTAVPAELPQAGASAGATLTLRPLLCAEMRGPAGWFERAEGPAAMLKALGIGVPADQLIRVPIVAFLLEHPTAGHVLVDTGFGRVVAEGASSERSRNLGAMGRLMTRAMSMRPEQAVAEQLRALGIDPDDVGLVVMTHLHFDHASALCDFPNASVLVSKREWQAARGRAPFMHGYVPAQLDPRPSYRTIDFGDAAAHGPFTHTVDLFGDGSLTLAYTPGHSAGHMSLLLRLGAGEALLTGDAVYTMATLRGDARPWRSEEPQAFERSLAQLAAWDREHPGALVIPGHDIQAWEELEDFYA
jgi:glyoxylase-like metal-dependent hydrolase (beta-lactamase superfamily II)